jgi:thymidylate synthase (FAD)
MKLIKPYFEIIEQQPGEVGMLKHIEAQGRVAWRSEDKITDDSYIKFVNMIKGVEHGSVLEHGTVYLKFNAYQTEKYFRYCHNKYSVANSKGSVESTLNAVYSDIDEDYFNAIHNGKISKEFKWKGFVTTNYRVLQDNNWLDDLKYQCEPTEFHEKRVTVKFNTQIAITREGNRHRVNSVTESSTRYCNYSKDKFNNEITINLPNNITEEKLSQANKYSSIIAIEGDEYGTLYEKETYEWLDIDWWLWANACTELAYMKLIEKGWTAQQARTILPLDTNTEVVYTAFVSDWKHFFKLRTAKSAHIDIRNLAIPLEEEFKRLKLI